MRFLEERAESLVFLDDSVVRMVRKDPYNIVKYKMFNGVRIRYVARIGTKTLRVEEEEEGGSAFLCELDGLGVRIRDTASVSKAIIEHATTGSVDLLVRLWQWHTLLEDLRLTVQPNSGTISVTSAGILSIPAAVRVDVLERAKYRDGSSVAKLLFTVTERSDWLYRAFRNHTCVVALIGRDETSQVWLHCLPPEYRERTITDCEVWLAGGEAGDTVVF